MRAKPVKQVLDAIPTNALGDAPPVWVPVFDGHVLPREPAEAFRAGKFNKVPIILGSNRDEGTLFVESDAKLTDAEYARRVYETFPLRGGLVLTQYPSSDYASPAQASAAWFGDWIFSCAVDRTAQMLSPQVPVYEYEFNDRNAPLASWAGKPSLPMGAYHSAEVQYLFPDRLKSQFSPAQQKLSEEMIGYWSRFIHSGDPGGTSPRWRRYRSGDDILSLAPGAIGYESDFAKQHHCPLWDIFRR
jgi:para-nitrobenzyl esterase